MLYEKSRDEFNRRKNLPFYHPEKIFTMGCWLRLYQMADVEPLTEAFSNQLVKLWDLFDIDGNVFNSLPSISFASMFRNYDQSLPYCFSFHPKFDEIRKLFHDNKIGGLTSCPARHVDLTGGTDSPHNARHVPNGNKITALTFHDENS